MSGPDQEISSSSGGGGNEDEDGVVNPSRKDGVKEGIGGKTEDESKRVFVFRFGKAKKTLQLLRRKRRKKKQKKGGGGLVNSGGCFGGWGGGGMVGCCLCGKQTAALDSSAALHKALGFREVSLLNPISVGLQKFSKTL
ncbi:OLC1v1038753C2 [Oldenlandia corymbosa var. corymbosa]|uniref:OLC1v1038753C2 n=1 Tax=Oldenlandia corymbosa var. corymbosa TaxID=529605 RepID=A0AAV1D1H5_OLDCO|nr:OLC1v1038753C2 [Oldenlandia corymbosa var. corymbosa]